VTENWLPYNQIKGRIQPSDGEHKALAEIGQQLGRTALEEIATIAKAETILACGRKFVAPKANGSV
jgi:hypothetical protein